MSATTRDSASRPRELDPHQHATAKAHGTAGSAPRLVPALDPNLLLSWDKNPDRSSSLRSQ